MPMASWQEEMLPGQSIWHLEYGNGEIVELDYDNKLVYCVFDYKSEKTPRAFDFDDVIGNFDERLNQWILPPPL